MRKPLRMALLLLMSLMAIVAGVALGSTNIPLDVQWAVLSNRFFGTALPENLSSVTPSILWNLRFPRALMAFAVGASLAASGTVMQSVLRNPLASSYTLGVSSGASLVAALVIVTGFEVLGRYTLPFFGFLGGLGTVFVAMSLALHFDRTLENQTVILVGMVLSLFVNALLTLVTALAADRLARLVYWQMGSFSGATWENVRLQFVVLIACVIALMRYGREMDLMTFGDEQALSAGVDLKRVKLILIGLSALLTGTAVSLVGVIGFVDLIAPHIMRRFFGSNHRVVVPASALFGGLLMVLADLASRTVLAPQELPVGAVTAIIGAPFFAYIYFHRKRGDAPC